MSTLLARGLLGEHAVCPCVVWFGFWAFQTQNRIFILFFELYTKVFVSVVQVIAGVEAVLGIFFPFSI
jgi:hypothetical protein